jgi:hypothetical protein
MCAVSRWNIQGNARQRILHLMSCELNNAILRGNKRYTVCVQHWFQREQNILSYVILCSAEYYK